MTKLELQMTNHELEARVIELESKLETAKFELREADEEIKELKEQSLVLRDDLEVADEMLAQHVADLKSVRYEEWYRQLHPGGSGSNPDLRVAHEPAKIMA